MRMKNYFTLLMFFSFLLTETHLWAQTSSLSEKDSIRMIEADELTRHHYYQDAIVIYKELSLQNKSRKDITLKLIDCHLKTRNTQDALILFVENFKDTSAGNLKGVPSHYFYNYAELLMMEEDTSEALGWYQVYLTKNPDDERAQKKITALKAGLHKHLPEWQYEVKELPINTSFNEFSPAFYKKGIVFVSDRHKVDLEDPDKTYLDLYYYSTETNTTPEKLPAAVNSDLHEGPCVIYDNDSKMIFTRNNTKDNDKSSEERIPIHLQLYYSEMNASGKWTKAVPLSFNSKEYSIGHPAITSDGKTLYFSSNMSGGKTGTDLFVSKFENGDWTKPERLGENVNTAGSEMFPFVCGDTLLYFASDGHAGLGGLDIYAYHLKSGTLKSFGIPLNSSRDDFGFILNANGDKGYFSSNRGTEKSVNDHLYEFDIQKSDIQEKISPDTNNTNVVSKAKVTPTAEIISEVYYTIQILALLNPKPVAKEFLRDHTGVLWHDGKDGFHRYTIGHYDKLETALVELEKIRSEYSDAFIRREKNYTILSKSPGIDIEKLYLITEK